MKRFPSWENAVLGGGFEGDLPRQPLFLNESGNLPLLLLTNSYAPPIARIMTIGHVTFVSPFFEQSISNPTFRGHAMTMRNLFDR